MIAIEGDMEDFGDSAAVLEEDAFAEEDGDVLAEDFLLGQAFAKAGLRAMLAVTPVHNYNVNATVASFVERHTRWLKMRVVVHKPGFVIDLLSNPVGLGLVAVGLSGFDLGFTGVWLALVLGKGISGNLFTSLSVIDVTTVQGAQDAQSIIDAAINEVSTARGTLGSFQKNTLESNLSNLRIAAQNLTAAESTIRDTDMAQQMSEFVKHQILLQAGTSMLAQGNQVPQVVLSLFQ